MLLFSSYIIHYYIHLDHNKEVAMPEEKNPKKEKKGKKPEGHGKYSGISWEVIHRPVSLSIFSNISREMPWSMM